MKWKQYHIFFKGRLKPDCRDKGMDIGADAKYPSEYFKKFYWSAWRIHKIWMRTCRIILKGQLFFPNLISNGELYVIAWKNRDTQKKSKCLYNILIFCRFCIRHINKDRRQVDFYKSTHPSQPTYSRWFWFRII